MQIAHEESDEEEAKTAEVKSLTASIEDKTQCIGELGVNIVKESLLEDKKFLAELEKGCATRVGDRAHICHCWKRKLCTSTWSHHCNSETHGRHYDSHLKRHHCHLSVKRVASTIDICWIIQDGGFMILLCKFGKDAQNASITSFRNQRYCFGIRY